MQPKSIRAFIGAKDYQVSRAFYLEFGFSETIVSPDMSYFHIDTFGFYLQDYYVKDWVDNSMIFLEVQDVEEELQRIKALELPSKYKRVRVSEIHYNEWGNEFFVHDPSGILWHIGEFTR